VNVFKAWAGLVRLRRPWLRPVVGGPRNQARRRAAARAARAQCARVSGSSSTSTGTAY